MTRGHKQRPSEQGTTFFIDPAYATVNTMSVLFMVAVVSGVSLVAFLTVITSTGLSYELGIAAIFLIVMMGYTLSANARWKRETWLRLTPMGIEYHTPGLTIATEWSNIIELREQNRQAYLMLRDRSTSYISTGTRFARSTTSAAWNIDTRIPLHPFAVWSAHNPLAIIIWDYAPHLRMHQ